MQVSSGADIDYAPTSKPMGARPGSRDRPAVAVATVNAEGASGPRGLAADLQALRFGVFEMDLRACELRKSGALVRIQPQPFKVLALLASRPGEAVTREEIQAEVWPVGVFVDFEQSLNFCIRQIRSALGDRALSPRFVETLPRRGYRWVGGPVEKTTASATVHEWSRARPFEAAATGEPAKPPAQPATEAASRSASRWPALAGATVAVAAILTGGWLAWHRSSHQSPAAFQRLTFRRGSISSARFAPNGQIVYAASYEGRPAVIQVTQVSSSDFRVLDNADGSVLAVSAAGEVAFLRGSVLARAPLAGGPPKDLLKPVAAADWNADASDLAVARWDKDHLRIECPVGHVLGEASSVSRLRLAPDGRRLAFVEHPLLGDDRGSIVVLDRAGRRVTVSEGWSSVEGLAWSPGGDEVWFTAARVGLESALHALSLDGRVRTLLSAMGRLVLHDVARDGRVLLERATARGEVLYRREGEKEDRDLSWLDFTTVEALSADGSTLLLLESGEAGGPDYATYLRRADGSIPVRLGPGRASDLSPDGQWVLSIPVRQQDRVDILPAGPWEARRVRVPGVAAHETAGWVGDGKTIYVTTRDTLGRRATWLVEAGGGSLRRLPLPQGSILKANTFSPDGRRFVAGCPEGQDACFYDTAAGNPRKVPGVRPGWTPVGWDEQDRIYFRDGSRGLPEVLQRVDPATARAEALAELAPRDRAGVIGVIRVVVARGGRAWAYTCLRRLSDLYVVTGVR